MTITDGNTVVTGARLKASASTVVKDRLCESSLIGLNLESPRRPAHSNWTGADIWSAVVLDEVA